MSARISVVHSTAPGCHWSWGYEAVVNRLKLVYGDQIDLVVRLGCPYDDWQQWLVDYGMSEDEAIEWFGEVLPTMGVPVAPVRKGGQPATVLPPSLAVLASLRFAPERAHRLNRALLRLFAVEGKDPARPEVLDAAAREAGVDAARLRREMQDDEGLRADLAAEAEKGPAVHAGFYNWVVTDGADRRVILDYAFEPEQVEGAIDYLSGGTLTKARPTDVAAYLREHGWAPLSEVRRVFALPERDALAKLESLEKEGRAERATLAGAPHWRGLA